ncbi:hypothetical protein KC318_g1992 [Hortaea werneckii]|nr:hypothetical protein KC334_g2080 [Hortaea werneckii]KAI7023576.1 hypothetical protein KC355_g1671 [Hortaea werneckii]KAI7673823.1 hypothetical protein KC318_g1992 [Hortaea werneckii]
MDFPRQRCVAPSNNIEGNQQLFKLYSPPPQGYAPLSSSRGGVPSFLLSDDHNPSLETSNYQRSMSNRSQNLDDARTSQQFLGSCQPFHSSTGIAQHSANHQQASQLTDDEEYLDFLKHFLGIKTTPDLNNALDLFMSQTYPAWDTSNQRANPKTIAPALLDARYPDSGFEDVPAGMNQSLHYPRTGSTTPTFTDNALPITAGNTKRRKIKASFDAGPSQTSTANFMPSQQKPSYSTEPTPNASHNFNRTHRGPSYSPGSMPTAETDFKGTQQWDVRRKTRMQNTGTNFTVSQQRPSNSIHPAANMPSPSHEQGLNYGSPAYSVSPPFQYQQPAGNHSVHQDVWTAPPSGQQASASMLTAQPTSFALTPSNKHAKGPSSSPSAGQFFSYSNPDVSVSPRFQYQQLAGSNNIHQNVWSAPSSSQYGAGLPAASMSPAQPTSHDLMPFNQHDNVPSPSTSTEQDYTFSYPSSASSLPFNTQESAEYDIFHQDIWSSPPSDQDGAELPTSSLTAAQLTPPNFLQDNQQGNNFSSGPQINIYQQNNVLSNGVQVNQPSNILSSGPQVNQLKNVLSSGPQVNQQSVGISSANIPSTQQAHFVPPQVNQQGNALSSGPQVNQQGVGISSANMPPAQAAPAALPQINQQGNAPSNGPQANQQNAVPLNGQQVNLHRNLANYDTGIYRLTGHNADMKSLHAIPPNAALPAMELSLTELLTYFPNHSTWPYVMLRFNAVGARPKRIAQGQLFVRGVIDEDATKSIDAKIRQQRREAGRVFFGVTTYTARAAENQLKTLSAGQVSYDVSAYTARVYHQPTVHTKLVDIARGVRLHPAGQDAGIFTQVVQHVLGNLATLADKTTADVVALANQPQLAFSYPAEKATDNWDKKCLERMIQLLKANGMP